MDPSLTPPSSEVEDDIIDLTDIVEKGSIPPASGDTGDGDSALKSLMADLLTGSDEASSKEDENFDLGALLKASGLDDEGDLAGTAAPVDGKAPSPAGGMPAAEPLDSADMGDVDALLRDLVAPEQPAASSAEAPSAPAADFGDVLQASAARQTPANGAGSESEEVDVDDLDSLLTSIMNPETDDTPPQPSPAPAAEPASDLSDLDALLDDAPADPPRPASSSASPGSKIPEQAPAQAAAAKQPPSVKAPAAGPAEPADELDLDALLGETPSPAKAPVSVPPDTKVHTEEDDDPLSGLDELLAASEDAPAAAERPAEGEPDNPLLIGEADVPASDHGSDRAGSVAANIAAVQKRMANLAAGGGGADASVLDALRECVADLAAEVRDLAESYANGLAAAEARISALEAELAAGGAPAPKSGDMTRLEQRLEALETSVEKAAAEAAARIIREEIAALLAEMGPEL